MATSYTTNAALQKPALNDRNWHTPINANADQLDATAPIGGLAVTRTEHPSATLNVKVAAGRYQRVTGVVGTYAGTASQAMTPSATNYAYLTDAGTLTVSTSGFPSASHVPLAIVTTDATTVTGITDQRIAFPACGNRAQAALTAANAGAINSGDATTDAVIGNMRTRINELESKLQALGLLA